jgi:hypothetical protein
LWRPKDNVLNVVIKNENDKVNLKRIEDLLLTLIQKVEKMNADLEAKIAELSTEVSESSAVVDSAVTLLSGLNQMLVDAIAALEASGVSPEQLTALDGLKGALDTKANELAAAVAANTR